MKQDLVLITLYAIVVGLPGGSGGKEYFNRKLVISFNIITFVNVEL